jgi:hypothetical protein
MSFDMTVDTGYSVGSIFFWFDFVVSCIADVYHIMSHAIMYSSKSQGRIEADHDRC